MRSLADFLQIRASKSYKAEQLMDERYWVPENLDQMYLSAEIPVFSKIWDKPVVIPIGRDFHQACEGNEV